MNSSEVNEVDVHFGLLALEFSGSKLVLLYIYLLVEFVDQFGQSFNILLYSGNGIILQNLDPLDLSHRSGNHQALIFDHKSAQAEFCHSTSLLIFELNPAISG